MKINEKSLAKYAGSGVPPDREGFLLKKGVLHKAFQRRWFILKGNLLFYYEKRADKDPLGVLVLEGCTVELSDLEDGFMFMLHFPGTSSRTYVLAADSQEDMEGWMKALSGASYDYLKICVTELQKTLKDLETNSNLALLKGAVKERKNLVESGFIKDSSMSASSSSSNHVATHHRHNPFNADYSFDRGSVSSQSENSPDYTDSSRVSTVEKKARTFLEMHADLSEQISEISKLWLEANPHSKLKWPSNKNCT
ncbi:SESQ1-like protein [Mya arenaria]|uniref:SESQ1-like protein n=1 Tax=Mya arenaria TaxID=6604 RepID=A0ABY7E0W1_MYAAR|nr:sesquipedalian-1-like [Mya arenaria]WAR02586.1 SESQ1-like protein [Mya arenaria]